MQMFASGACRHVANRPGAPVQPSRMGWTLLHPNGILAASCSARNARSCSVGFRASFFYPYGMLVTGRYLAHDDGAASSRNPYDGKMNENYYNNAFSGVSFNSALGCTALRSSGYAQVRHHQHSHGLEAYPRGVRNARKAVRRAWQRGRN